MKYQINLKSAKQEKINSLDIERKELFKASGIEGYFTIKDFERVLPVLSEADIKTLLNHIPKYAY
jgi:hypothetical protein